MVSIGDCASTSTCDLSVPVLSLFVFSLLGHHFATYNLPSFQKNCNIMQLHVILWNTLQYKMIQYNTIRLILAGQKKTYHEAPMANGMPSIGGQTQGTAVIIGNDELVDTSSLSVVTSSCQKM